MKKIIKGLKTKSVKLAEYLHLKFFGHEMSETMRKFLENLSWSFFGGIISAGILAVINIIAGRILGPEEFGKFGLMLALANIFIILMTFGLDVSVTYYIAKNQNKNEKRKYTNLAFSLFLIILTITSLFLFYFSKFLSNKLHINNLIIDMAIFFAVMLSFKNFFDALARGWKIFKWQAIVRLLEVSLVLCLFVILVFLRRFNSFDDYTKIIIAGYVVSVSLIGLKLIKNFKFTLDKASKILRYGKYVILGAINGVMLNSLDKIFINKYLGTTSLGVYNAYSAVSTIVVAQVVVIFINVFFPSLSAIKNKKIIMQKINKLFIIMFIPLFWLFYGLVILAILLFGKKYPLDYVLAGEFSFLTLITGYFSILWWLIASTGEKGIKFTSFNGIVLGLIFVSLVFAFKVVLTLNLVILFLVIANLYAIVIGNLMKEKYL